MPSDGMACAWAAVCKWYHTNVRRQATCCMHPTCARAARTWPLLPCAPGLSSRAHLAPLCVWRREEQGSGTLPVGTQVTALLTSTSLSVTARVHTGLSLPVAPPSSGAAEPAPWKLAGATAKPIIGVLTVSDRASRGVYEDVSGPLIGQVLREYLATDCHWITRMVPDELSDIAAALRDMVAAGCSLVCTTGGTGPAARDVTPEAMALVCNKTYDGFGEAMRRASLDAGVPTAILSRQSAASVGQTLIINLPGKPQAIRTCLDAVFPAGPASCHPLSLLFPAFAHARAA